ncbi:TPA: hypothetical protein EYP45_02650, partial [Candidatus Peregrinibacteria bacterium]|nr:hypothetical protein [Candidatus Peregrinibacteria bacterium]
MQEVKKAKIEFKNKFTGLGSMIAWIFNKFLGIDIKDPLASGGLVSIGRMIAGVESPENADKYDITKNATLRSKFLTAKDIQKISIASVITPQVMQSIFSRKNIFSSEKVKKSVEENWK